MSDYAPADDNVDSSQPDTADENAGDAETTTDVPQAADETPSSVTGSGAPVFQARANVALRDLAVGDVGTFAEDDEEARANLVNGNLSRVEA